MSLQNQVHPILTILSDTALKLSELSPVQKKQEIEIIVSYDMYKDAVAEFAGRSMWPEPTTLYTDLSIRVVNGLQFKISCKELKEAELNKKFTKCFKYLTEGLELNK